MRDKSFFILRRNANYHSKKFCGSKRPILLSNCTFNLVSPSEIWIIFYSHLIVARNLINQSDNSGIINVFKKILGRSNYLAPTADTLTNWIYILEAIYDESTRTYIAVTANPR